MLKKAFIKKTQNIFERFGIYIASANQNPDLHKRLVKFLNDKKIDFVFDVGANEGGFARELFSKKFKGKIISFEPTQEAYNKLMILAKNNLRWTVEKKCAIGGSEKEIEINVSENSVSSSIIPVKEEEAKKWPGLKIVKKEKVQMYKLDNFIKKYGKINKRLFLKLDTQGYEMNILKACKNLHKFEGINLEVQIKQYYKTNFSFENIFNLLAKKEFKLVDLEPGFRDKDGSVIEFDAVFLKRN